MWRRASPAHSPENHPAVGHVVFRPPDDLSEYVQVLWLGGGLPGPGTVHREVIPDGNTDILVGLSPTDCRIHLFGPATRRAIMATPLETVLFGLRFHPGMAPVLADVASADLTDSCVELDGLWGMSRAELGERLAAAPDRRDAMLFFRDILRASPKRHMTTGVCRRASRLAREGAGIVRVGELARLAGIGRRRLERIFQSDMGMAPKTFLRLLRLQRAVLGLCDCPAGQARLACDCGFSDQAHMVREFRDLVGKTPIQTARILHARLVADELTPGVAIHDLT